MARTKVFMTQELLSNIIADFTALSEKIAAHTRTLKVLKDAGIDDDTFKHVASEMHSLKEARVEMSNKAIRKIVARVNEKLPELASNDPDAFAAFVLANIAPLFPINAKDATAADFVGEVEN